VPGRHGVNRWELRTCARRGHVTYAPDDERGAVEIYDFATVSHDFPSPREPAYPSDPDKFGGIEWERVSRERSRLHDVWVRDPRNTVTITALTDEGARLLKRAHDAVVNPFTVVGVVSYDPETDSLS